MAETTNQTGLKCLKVLFSRFRPGVNFSALLTAEFGKKMAENEVSALLDLAATQDLRPESSGSTEIFKSYRGPALIRLKNGNYGK